MNGTRTDTGKPASSVFPWPTLNSLFPFWETNFPVCSQHSVKMENTFFNSIAINGNDNTAKKSHKIKQILTAKLVRSSLRSVYSVQSCKGLILAILRG